MLGSLVTPEPLGRVFGWQLWVRTIRGLRSPKRTMLTSRGLSAGMWTSSLKGVFTPRLVDSYRAKGVAIMVCQDKETRDWLAASVPTLVAWEGSRLKMVDLDALPTYKRVVAWLLGPVEDTEQYFQRLRRLNQGLDIGQSVSTRRNPMGSALCSVLIQLLLLDWRKCVGDPSVGWDKPSSPFLVLNQKGRNRKGEEEEEEEEEEEAELDMVSTISFSQANLQHSIAASRVFTRTVASKE
jgi:hypothetical protein